MASIAVPAAAQREPIDRRVDRIEQQLRAVQRRVFPDGQIPAVEPEIGPQRPAAPGGIAGSDALSNLTSRVDALESQLRNLTGQVEESNYRLRQMEQQLDQLRTDTTARLDRVERQAAPAQQPVPAEPQATPASEPDAPPAAAADPAEAAYNAGYRLWNDKRYGEAQTALEAVAAQYPRSRWASWARNLAGRAYLDDNKPATAARILLANYQENPQGERAADSLYFLGQALTRLNRRSEACRVYDELEEVYPNMRAFLKERLPQARRDARCTAAAT